MIRLSGFADEISPDLDEQVEVLTSEGIHWIDLRGAWDTNVLDLTDDQVRTIKHTLESQGIRVAAIGSPVGKTPVVEPLENVMERLDRAIALAEVFETPFIRIFSFYPPEGTDPSECRDEVVARLRALTARAAEAGVTLLHENDTGLYGDSVARCAELLKSIDDPHFAALFDPANFVVSHEVAYPDGYEASRDRLRYVHVKDARSDGTVVPVGEGLAGWPEILQRLRQDGYDGFLSLEPHLRAAGQFAGFSGPDRFRQAAQALQTMLRAMDWEYQ